MLRLHSDTFFFFCNCSFQTRRYPTGVRNERKGFDGRHISHTPSPRQWAKVEKVLANRGATARERRVHVAASMQRKCKAPRSFREDANPEAFKEVRLIFLIIFFSFFRAERATFAGVCGDQHTYIRTRLCRENNRRSTHGGQNSKPHVHIHISLCLQSSSWPCQKGDRERERETVEDTYVQTAPKVYETRHLRRDIHAIIR